MGPCQDTSRGRDRVGHDLVCHAPPQHWTAYRSPSALRICRRMCLCPWATSRFYFTQSRQRRQHSAGGALSHFVQLVFMSHPQWERSARWLRAECEGAPRSNGERSVRAFRAEWEGWDGVDVVELLLRERECGR